jgi:hypothetical protein
MVRKEIMKIYNGETGEEVETTPQEFMEFIAEDVAKYKALMEKIASYEEE